VQRGVLAALQLIPLSLCTYLANPALKKQDSEHLQNIDAYDDTDDVESLVRTPLPKHTEFGTLLARWQDVARRFRERSREGRRKRRREDCKKGLLELSVVVVERKVRYLYGYISFVFVFFCFFVWRIPVVFIMGRSRSSRNLSI